ncbi:hypothetical protein D3C87_2162730 [compost metagenome]
MADVEFNFLPTINSILKRISCGVSGRWDRVGHVTDDADDIIVAFNRHLRVHVNTGVTADST